MTRPRMSREELKAAEKARAMAKARAKAEVKAEEKARAEQRARAKAEAKAAEKARAEERARAKTMAKAKAKARAMAMAEEKAKAMADMKYERMAEKAKAMAMAEEKAKAKAEEKPRAMAKAKAKAEEKARAMAKAKAKARARAMAMAKAKAKAEEKPRAMAKAKAKAAEKPRAMAIAKAKAKAKAKAEERAKRRIPTAKMPRFPTLQIGGRMAGKRIIALSIEGTDLRLVSFYNNSIKSWDSVPFDPQLLREGQVADPEGLGGVVKSALEGREVSKSQVVCAIPELRAVSRVLSMPRVDPKELETIVPREVRRLMTVSEEDNYLHWQAIPTETGPIPVFVVAVPRETLLAFMEALRGGGVRPRALDLRSLALVRAVNQKDAIIANGESNSLELVIVVDDVPVLIRSVFLGEEVMTQDYAVGRISDELGRTIVTYNDINKDNPLDPEVPVYLSGATAGGVSFALNVAALTGRTVQPLEPPIPCPEDFPLAEFMVNVGLILKLL